MKSVICYKCSKKFSHASVRYLWIVNVRHRQTSPDHKKNSNKLTHATQKYVVTTNDQALVIQPSREENSE